MKRSISVCIGLFVMSAVAFSCKSKKSGCDAYGQNSQAKKNIEQSR